MALKRKKLPLNQNRNLGFASRYLRRDSHVGGAPIILIIVLLLFGFECKGDLARLLVKLDRNVVLS